MRRPGHLLFQWATTALSRAISALWCHIPPAGRPVVSHESATAGEHPPRRVGAAGQGRLPGRDAAARARRGRAYRGPARGEPARHQVRHADHRRVLDAAPELLAIGAFCIGVNQIDLAAASRHGIAVFNAPFSNTRSVVELAVAQIIAMARRLPEKNAQMHAGVWDKSAAGSHEVRGRTLGIVGYGNIGTQLSVLAEALGMTVYFYDVADKLALGNARRCSTLDELLELAETVTPARGRAGRQPGFLRRGRVRRDAAAVAVPEPVPRLRGRPRGAAAQYRVRAHRRGGHRRVPHRSRRAAATSSSPSCAGCRTSSSPRTSAAPPRRPSRTSASSSRTSSPST